MNWLRSKWRRDVERNLDTLERALESLRDDYWQLKRDHLMLLDYLGLKQAYKPETRSLIKRQEPGSDDDEK